VSELVARFETLLPDGLGHDERLTLVYDAGQNSEESYETLDATPPHFVGSLPSSDHPDLLAVLEDRYRVVDEDARALLEKEIFGKQILVTDKNIEQASTATIVAGYRSQEVAEGDFRQMKDPKVVSCSPMFHFTEQKIRVHIYYCVLALTVTKLMTRQADRAGMHMSQRAPQAAGPP